MNRAICSFDELQSVCLEKLKQCDGFERVNEILVQPRENAGEAANWTLAAVRPRVDNNSLRGARGAIGYLQQNFELHEEDARALARRRRGQGPVGGA